MLNDVINFLIPIIVAVVLGVFILKMFLSFIQGIPRRARTDIEPTNIGDRLKKYLVKASQANPHTAKVLKIRRTKYNEGGTVGYITGAVPTRTYTRFIFKTGRFGFKKVLYCPSNIHTSLHYREVFLNAVALENAGGFYYTIPYEGMSNSQAFHIAHTAFLSDLKKMEIMDVHQLELEQVYSGISGIDRERELVEEAPEDIEYVEQSEEDEPRAS